MANCVFFEILCRRRTLLEEAHAVSPSNPDYSAADVIMGLGEKRGAGHVSRQMQAYTAQVLKDRAAVQKEKRKAGEESSLRRGNKNQEANKDKTK